MLLPEIIPMGTFVDDVWAKRDPAILNFEVIINVRNNFVFEQSENCR